MPIRNIIIAILFFFSIPVSGQVSIQFIPEVHGRNIDGLFQASILNTTQQQASVSLTVVVTESNAGKILTLQTQPFTLYPGNNPIPASAIRSANIQAGTSNIARLVQQSGYFPQGAYEYSFTLDSKISIGIPEQIEQTFDYELTPSAPLSLIEPFDQDKICEKNPLLTWQPSLPAIPGLLYQLQLVEIKERQNAIEALNYNLPLVNQNGIFNHILLYPPSAKALEEGKSYAWQVTAYRSDVWEFMVDCKDSVETEKETDKSYRDIEDLLKGKYYVARREVRFALINSYAEQPLSYQITCVTNPKQKIRRMPKLILKTGRNQISLDLSTNSAFKDGYSYILKVILPNGSSKSLRFLYKDIEG